MRSSLLPPQKKQRSKAWNGWYMPVILATIELARRITGTLVLGLDQEFKTSNIAKPCLKTN
jgi:hypothetical protein